jgi:hypothetical protein
MMPQAENDLKCWITYCLPGAISGGAAPVVSIEGGLGYLREQLDSFDQYIVCYSIVSIEEMLKAGYQEEIVKEGIPGKLLLLMEHEDSSVREYSRSLHEKIVSWEDHISRNGDVMVKPDKDLTIIKQEKKFVPKEEKMEARSGEDSYVRPKARDLKKKRKKGVLTSSGTNADLDKDRDETVELPSESTRPLEERLRGEKRDEKEEEFEITLEE